jgi:hypothetical protein
VATTIVNSSRFRTLAALLRDQAALHGLTFVAGEAEQILSDRVTAVATQLRVTERTALERYLSEDIIAELAATLGQQAASYRDAAEDAEPVHIGIADAGRVAAGVGMSLKLAAEHAETNRTEALGIITDAADAVVGLGVAINAAGTSDSVAVGGRTLVYVRGVLVSTIGHLRDGTWACPCPGPHSGKLTCSLASSLVADLNRVGGWIADESEQDSSAR